MLGTILKPTDECRTKSVTIKHKNCRQRKREIILRPNVTINQVSSFWVAALFCAMNWSAANWSIAIAVVIVIRSHPAGYLFCCNYERCGKVSSSKNTPHSQQPFPLLSRGHHQLHGVAEPFKCIQTGVMATHQTHSPIFKRNVLISSVSSLTLWRRQEQCNDWWLVWKTKV